jgi:hypothetical protein
MLPCLARWSPFILVVCLFSSFGGELCAQAPDPAAPLPPAPAASAVPPRHEAEQNVVNLPTTQPLHRFGSHFRITHRFARDLRHGGFGELASNLFGLDNGALIGLDYRFAPLTNVQVGFYRAMLFRTIQLSGRVDAWKQGESMPVALSLLASVEGANNMRDNHAPAFGLVASRTIGSAIAFYVSPTVVWHSQIPTSRPLEGHEDHDGVSHEELVASVPDETTGYVGFGARVKVRPTTFIVGEFAPRVAGYAPGRGNWAIAIEKQTRGHVFQLNFSNSFGTTFGQIARGGEKSNVYLGFNLARKF